ncbi:hypothetical protein IAD21_06423 (plasmid) [Abditibacteriota bacterium]|nr:hypothetical protein IAD21_06423 [Abditibacteriota bacterium]
MGQDANSKKSLIISLKFKKRPLLDDLCIRAGLSVFIHYLTLHNNATRKNIITDVTGLARMNVM